jgi:D-3-phosphoglycerate dehydrogenase
MSQARWKVVITDCDHGSIEEEKEEYSRLGAELVFVQVRSEEDLIRVCRDADGALNQYTLMTRRVLENCPKLKVIVRYGIGVDSIDLQAATDLGIIVGNVPDYCLDEVADHAMALLLTLARKTAFLNAEVKSGRWDFRLGPANRRIRGKTLGLVGCGKIGLGMAHRGASFGMKVISYDPYIQKAGEGIELVDFDTLLKTSDYISVHCPLTESTRHLLGVEAFSKMERKPIFVNTSRGPVVDEKALIDALQQGRVAAAGLDVLDREPVEPGNPLIGMENVILTPHMAWFSTESISVLKRSSAEAVSAVLTGTKPRSVVNRNVLGKSRAGV